MTEPKMRSFSSKRVLGIALYFAIPTALLAGFHPIAWNLTAIQSESWPNNSGKRRLM